MFDERYSLGERISNIIADTNKTGWHVIHAGKESGPFSDSELTEKAAVYEIDPDDLVKQTGGMWIKARDVAILQEPLRLRRVKEETVDQLGRFHGVWLSKKALVIGGGILLVLTTLGVVIALKATRPGTPGEEANIAKPVPESEDVRARVEKFKTKLIPFMTYQQYLDSFPRPRVDKSEDISPEDAFLEFKVQIRHDEGACTERFFPFETLGGAGPKYRVNLLWVVPKNIPVEEFPKRCYLRAKYYRSPD